MQTEDQFIVTSIGLQVPVNNPEPYHIALKDLAHHLATNNRFRGAADRPINEAQHALIMAQLLERHSPRLALLGLLHHGYKAYTDRAELAPLFELAIHQRFGVAPPDAKEREALLLINETAFATEWRDLMPDGVPCPKFASPASFRVKPLPWDKAEEAYLAAFDKLSRLVGTHGAEL